MERNFALLTNISGGFAMIRQITVGNLCGELDEMLHKLQYSSDSLRRYNKVFDEFTAYAGEKMYSQALGAEFLAWKFDQIGGFTAEGLYSKDEMYYFRVIRSLAEYFNFGVIFRRHDFHGEIIWPVPFRECTEKFFLSKVEYGVSYGYVRHARLVIKDLILFLDAEGIHSPGAVCYIHVERFIGTLVGWATATVRSRISVIRGYFRFLFLDGYIQEPIADKIPSGLTPRGRKKLPTVWSEEEIDRLIKGVDLASPNGKRNYAILLIAARLGLRIGDIRELQLSDIDWQACTLTIVQNKTKEPLTLPISDDVGWAIIDYLKNGRPVTESSNIFVRHVPPYDGFAPTSNLYNVIAKALSNAGIPSEKKAGGFHTLRHSLATHLLQGGVGASTISDILGHTSPETVKHYLSSDIEGLRKCALEVEVKPYVKE